MNPAFDELACGFVAFADDGRILAVNTTLCAMLGYAREELLGGQHVQVLLSAGGRVFFQTHLFPLLKLQGEVEEIYFSLLTKGGEEVPFLLNGRRAQNGSGFESACVLVRMRQRSHFEAELLSARKAAQKASQAKDAFMAALSHELRNPLSPVLMLSTSMELDESLPAEVREQAGHIRRNAELETRLIDDLLDHTRITHGKLSLVLAPVDLHAILRDTEEIVKSESSAKRISVTFEKAAAQRHTRGDAARLQQVFWNVIKNAVKFTPSGGQVRVVTSNDPDGHVLVRVTDTGVGIPPDVLPRIFDPFEQGRVSNPVFGGLGLGLSISKRIVEMHQGSIHAESPGPGQGATFCISFRTIPAPADAHRRAPEARAAKRSLRLLIVEDHESTRHVLARVLQRAGHDVEAAATGAEAIALLQSAGPFDAMISDLGLPDQSGHELVKTARQIQPSLPAIALSGYGMEEDIERANAAGFMAHLVKPVALEHLRALLDRVGDDRR